MGSEPVKPRQFPVPVTSVGTTPLRRPGSIRRTTSIDSKWPEGVAQPRIMRGQARDLYTPEAGAARVIAQAEFELSVSPKREMLSLSVSPPTPEAQKLVGIQAGSPRGSSRAIIAEQLGHLAGTPLFQLLDDYSGTSLVSVWGWMRWSELSGNGPLDFIGKPMDMTNICIGHAAGASSLGPGGSSNQQLQQVVPVPPFVNPADPEGWHEMADQAGPAHRRARRIDVWREESITRVDSWFQDSAPSPDGGRIAVHEYLVTAEIGPDETITDLRATGLILPYAECPGSVTEIHRLIGQPVSSLRKVVPVTLAGPLGCTHLNDVLRALADVPALAAQIAGAVPA
ncbi:MAG TPA: DUF2889 domain-containing protein [Novosphingobium sp.]|nr:DUF2889 domain-containing protein [Novosphingobium sp.]